MAREKQRKVTDIGPFFEAREGDVVQACGPIFEGIKCTGTIISFDGEFATIDWERTEYKIDGGSMILGDKRRPEGLHLIERSGDNEEE